MSNLWMPLYIGDYTRDTLRLTTIQHGAYLLLLMAYWQGDGLPDDDKMLAAIVKMTPAEWKKHRETLLSFFHDGWKHKRVDAELAETRKRRDAAKASAEKRWKDKKGCQSDATAYANAMRPHMPNGCYSQSPSLPSQEDEHLEKVGSQLVVVHGGRR